MVFILLKHLILQILSLYYVGIIQGAKVNRASLIRVYVNMKYNRINDNYIVDFKVESMIKDDDVLEHPYTPTKANDAMLIGFEIEELILGIEQDELAETIQDFFINYFEEQYSK